jgi:CheY-like chemotaxis protein
VKSKKAEGTTFSINFGIGEQSVVNKSVISYANLPHLQDYSVNKTVLVVEDDLMNQITIKKFIANIYTPIVTGSSDDAMEILNKGNIDLILMDISINGTMNGLELTKDLKQSKEFSNIPVIVITAHAFEEDKQNAFKAGCDNFLAKPFTKESLLEMIKLYLNKPG